MYPCKTCYLWGRLHPQSTVSQSVVNAPACLLTLGFFFSPRLPQGDGETGTGTTRDDEATRDPATDGDMHDPPHPHSSSSLQTPIPIQSDAAAQAQTGGTLEQMDGRGGGGRPVGRVHGAATARQMTGASTGLV